jgi:hypothetical protein
MLVVIYTGQKRRIGYMPNRTSTGTGTTRGMQKVFPAFFDFNSISSTRTKGTLINCGYVDR